MTMQTVLNRRPRKLAPKGGRRPQTRDELIRGHTSLVRFVAQRIALRLPRQVELDDLIGAGTLGLIDAVDKFDPSRGIAFKTYAELRIRGAILDELRLLDWVPRSIRHKQRELNRLAARLEQQLGAPPTSEDLATALGITPGELHRRLDRIRGYTLGSFEEMGAPDGEIAPDEKLGRFAAAPEEESPLEVCHRARLLERVAAAIDTLPRQQQTVMHFYYDRGLTMRETGRCLGVTESRVSQLHSQALRTLRRRLADVA